LKQHKHGNCRFENRAIPRSRDRGPIEAPIRPRSNTGPREIPRSRDRGPIEAAWVTDATNKTLHNSAIARSRPH